MSNFFHTWRNTSEALAWAWAQTNDELRDGSVLFAEDVLKKAGLPLHPDPAKNWGIVLALYHALERTSDAEHILDASAQRIEQLANSLHVLGHSNVTGVASAADVPRDLSLFKSGANETDRCAYITCMDGFVPGSRAAMLFLSRTSRNQ